MNLFYLIISDKMVDKNYEITLGTFKILSLEKIKYTLVLQLSLTLCISLPLGAKI